MSLLDNLSTLTLAQQLIQKPSVTPNDAGCQELIARFLSELGFTVQHFDRGRVNNLWARYGEQDPLFVFAGHTDVVPTGNLSDWTTPPFEPEIREHYLFGRGACDMKGALAAMLIAASNFLKSKKKMQGSLGFLITSAEEGDDFADGTPHVMQLVSESHQIPRYCLVGEPSSETLLGDTIKIGRRGSLTGYLTIIGKQGHVAYPQYAENPVHLATQLMDTLVHTSWDQGDEYFPPTSFQITKIQADTGSSNVIPGELQVIFNFRYAPISSFETLQEWVETLLRKQGLNFKIHWRLNGLPFLTQASPLLEAAQKAIKHITDIEPILSTNGGTSDGRFIAPYGVDVIELGLINKTIHQINESASVESLQQLTAIYENILTRLL